MQSCEPHGFTLKHAQVTVGPLHGPSMATQDGSNGGRQQLPESAVPVGQ
jgi:hypothetical protein